MKTKKVTAILLAAAVSVSMAACGNSENNSAEKKEGNETLSVAIWDNIQLSGLKEIANDFTDETGIKVEFQVLPWDQYWTLLEAGAQGGELPDVFWMHSTYSQRYMDNDILLDLTDKIEQSEKIDMKNYYADIAELYQLNEKIYAIPKDYDTIALWYNKKMFDDAGIEYPDETWTWETFAETAKKLTTGDGAQYGTAIPAIFNQDGYYNLIFDMGGYIVSDDKTKSGWDDPKTIEAMNWFYDNVVTTSMPTQEIMGESTPDVLFGSGKIAMTLQGSWMVNSLKENDYVKENCDIAVLPMAEDGTRKSIYNGLGWAAAADGKNTENAWKLIEYFGTEEAQKKQAELGVTMSAYMGTSDAWAKSSPEFNLQAYLDMTKDMEIRPYTRNTKIWEDYSQDVMKRVYMNEITMEEGCKEIAAYMNESIAEE